MTVEGWKITSNRRRSRDSPVRAESDYSLRFLDTYDCPLHMIAEYLHNMLVRLTPIIRGPPGQPQAILSLSEHPY